MKQIFTPCVLCLTLALASPSPLLAQDAQTDREEGFSLMERGFRLLFDGLMQDMEPALDEMAKAMKDLEPMARQLAELVGDVQNYDPPERLDNGDIIIRRKIGAPPPPDLPAPDTNPPLDQKPEGQIEL
ncbi:hypothetical protein [Pseudorhodobacter ferrugineus]|nr:hypothetical protein [Pseudorhodobacter ferrugineus]